MAKLQLKTPGGRAVAGVTGNTPYFGTMVTGEYLRKLDGQKGRLVFDEMRRSDPQVISILKAITLPIRSCEYSVEPATEDEADIEVAEVLEDGLKEQMSMTWDDTIRHALLMLPMGFSILEKVWEKRDDRIMLKKLDPRLPQSIIRWDYDGTGQTLIGPVQVDADGKEYHLPIEKILVFTTDREGDNWEGVSILRPAYKPWYIKNDLEKINAIKHDRHGVGVPKMKVPASVTPDTAEYKKVEALLERFYANEQGYLVEPEGYEVSILGAAQNAGTDALPSIKYCDESIARAMLAMFIQLGSTETGSRALGESFVDVFLLSLQAFADYIAEVLNRFLIKEWVDYNWDVEEYPTIRAGRIKTLDAQVLQQLASAKLITPDRTLEGTIREALHLPEQEEQDEAQEPVTEGPAVEEPAAEEPVTDEPQEEVAASEYRLADRQAPTKEEQLCDYHGAELRLNAAEVSLTKELLDLRAKQASDLIMQLVGGRAVQNLRVLYKKDVYDLLVGELKKQMRAGAQDVAQEVRRQRPDISLADPRRRAKVAAKEVEELALDQTSLDVESYAEGLKSQFARWSLDLRKVGLQGEQLKVAMLARFAEVSEAPVEGLAAGAVGRGWGAGRASGFEAVEDEIDYCYRSAILDGRACEVCRQKDGKHHGVGDPEFETPDPECEGTDRRCRCMTIAVMKAESAVDQEGAGQFGGGDRDGEVAKG